MLPRSSRWMRRRLHSAAARNDSVKITTLPNKLRVATESTPGHFTSVGLYVDAGSRYENASNSGVSHFLDRLAFKSSANLSGDQMSAVVDSLGGQVMSASSREAIMYQASHFGSEIPSALSIMAETILRPQFLPEELDLVRDSTLYEVRELKSKPEVILPEVLHEVAFGNQGLGNPLICPEDRMDLVSADTLRGFMEDWYRPERIVIAGAGIIHDELVELAHKHFSVLQPTVNTVPSQSRPHTIPSQLLSHPASPASKSFARAASSYYSVSPEHSGLLSHYQGGHKYLHVPDSQLTHIYIAFEGVAIDDPDIYALAAMQFLLGGGGSFSAGGPGKGMYSRLYTHVLNHHAEIDHCAAFHHIYTDTSLFGLFASFFPPGATAPVRGATPKQILPHLVHQFSLLLHTPVSAVDLSRAKNQLKSSLVMALESRVVEVEDLGRQILVHGRKIPVAEMCDRVDEVTADDIRRVSHRIFGNDNIKPPTLLVQGSDDLADPSRVFRKYGVGGQNA